MQSKVKDEKMKSKIVFLLILLAALFTLSAEENMGMAGKFPEKLLTASGREVNTVAALQGKKIIAVYFSASWCGPCRGFTPHLVNFHKKVKRKKNIEIVFASSDRREEDMFNYMKKYSMPWLAVPFNDPAVKNLRKEARTAGIPQLTIFDENGKILSRNGRWDVMMLGADAVDAWTSADYKPLTYQDYQNRRVSSDDRYDRNDRYDGKKRRGRKTKVSRFRC